MLATITGTIHIQCSMTHPVIRIAREENTFANPAFISAKRAGRVIRGIAPKIFTYSRVEGGYVFPRGYGKRLHNLAVAQGVPVQWTDVRVNVPAAYPDKLIGLDMRDYQGLAVLAGRETTQGVIVAPTGAGKTAIALELIRSRSQRAMIIVHSIMLATQWQKVIKERLGLDAGLIGDGSWTVGREITVASMQTLHSRQEDTLALARKIGMVVVDECHHAPSPTYANVIGLFPSVFRYGVTATPKRGDGLEKYVYRLLGDPIFIVGSESVQEVGGIVPASIELMDTHCQFQGVKPESKTAFSDLLKAMAVDHSRNALIAEKTIAVSQTRQTLVVTAHVGHAENLAAMIPGAILIHGRLSPKERLARVAAIETARVVVATRQLVGEGIDISVWSGVIMASPISGATPLLQVIGRGLRTSPGKTDCLVVDFVDAHPFTLGMYQRRATIYRQRKWPMNKVTA